MKTGIERCRAGSIPNNTPKEKRKLVMFDTFMKVVTFMIVFHGLTMVTLSYILAFMDKIQIAESLSQTVVKEIVAPFTIYGITKTIENVSKYNDWIKIIKANREDTYDGLNV